MEFKDVRVTKDGLKRLIDFLHSDKNIIVSRQMDSSSEHRVFGLSEASQVIGTPNEPLNSYEVTIRNYFGTIPEENFKALTQALTEAYTDHVHPQD